MRVGVVCAKRRYSLGDIARVSLIPLPAGDDPLNTKRPRITLQTQRDVPRVFRSSFVLLQALMHPREVHDAPTLSARVSPEKVLDLLKSGRTAAEVAAGLDVTEQTIYNWLGPGAHRYRTEAGAELDRERKNSPPPVVVSPSGRPSLPSLRAPRNC